jgi:hypothetical protein
MELAHVAAPDTQILDVNNRGGLQQLDAGHPSPGVAILCHKLMTLVKLAMSVSLANPGLPIQPA